MSRESRVDAGAFYAEYHGHPIALLEQLHARLSASSSSVIFLAGDSSMDNKHWFFEPGRTKRAQMSAPAFTAPATPNGYDRALRPPRMVMDVAYHLNALAPEGVVALNCAVEESTVSDRGDGLLDHDRFIRDHVTERDYVVLSVGGNDVALKPTAATVANMLMLTRAPGWLLRGGCAIGMGHFEWLFRTQIGAIVRRMVAGARKPKLVLVCMIYYLDERPGNSWADRVLAGLGYDDDPAKLQYIIATLYERIAAKGFDVDGVEVRPFPLFKVLDGKDTADYVQRVEPSVKGGRKIARAFLDELFPTSPEEDASRL